MRLRGRFRVAAEVFVMLARILGVWAGPFPIPDPRAARTAFASIQNGCCKSITRRATFSGHKWDPNSTTYDEVSESSRTKENGEYDTDTGKFKGFVIKRKYCACTHCGAKCQFRLVRLAFDGEEISLSVVGKLPLVVGVLWTCCFACVSV
jgi:hypothetical protein